MSLDPQPYLSPEYQARALADFLAQHLKPYDPETDDYDRPPFAADIKEGKNDPIYNAHSYHTKVPPRSIIPYILHEARCVRPRLQEFTHGYGSPPATDCQRLRCRVRSLGRRPPLCPGAAGNSIWKQFHCGKLWINPVRSPGFLAERFPLWCVASGSVDASLDTEARKDFL